MSISATNRDGTCDFDIGYLFPIIVIYIAATEVYIVAACDTIWDPHRN